MRNILGFVCAAVLGGAIGGWVTHLARAESADAKAQIVAREFVLVDAANRPSARLESKDGTSQLIFLSSKGSPSLVVGVDTRHHARFLHMFGKNGEVLATLNSWGANGESTLTLGDERREVRLILGAFPSDMNQGDESIDDWGMELRSLESHMSVFSVMNPPKGKAKSPAAFLRIVQPDGRVRFK